MSPCSPVTPHFLFPGLMVFTPFACRSSSCSVLSPLSSPLHVPLVWGSYCSFVHLITSSMYLLFPIVSPSPSAFQQCEFSHPLSICGCFILGLGLFLRALRVRCSFSSSCVFCGLHWTSASISLTVCSSICTYSNAACNKWFLVKNKDLVKLV